MKQQLPSWVVVLILAAVIAAIAAYAIKKTSVQRGVGKPPAPPPAGMGMGGGGMGGGSGAQPGGGGALSPAASQGEKKDSEKK